MARHGLLNLSGNHKKESFYEFLGSTTTMNSYGQKSSRRPVLFTAALTTAFFFAFYALFLQPVFAADNTPSVTSAVGIFRTDNGTVIGTVTFQQSYGEGPVTISGNVTNLDPSSKRGFHVHTAGDLTNGCTSAGVHFNPFNQTHGGPDDAIRHVGDLGNIQSDAYGKAVFNFTDKIISLNGPQSIVGRSAVVHAGTDDLGKGGDAESLKTGNSGTRLACAVIGIAAY